MKCPLFVMTASRIARSQAPEYIGCLKEECAWWISAFGVCSVFEIAVRLGSLADNLFSIMERMPHEEQFRK